MKRILLLIAVIAFASCKPRKGSELDNLMNTHTVVVMNHHGDTLARYENVREYYGTVHGVIEIRTTDNRRIGVHGAIVIGEIEN